jgi:SAM-dependent methyltransferase
MNTTLIRFEDGATYERFMGVWSRKVGDRFLDWLKPEAGLAWIDVGCGNGAFTELLAECCQPSRILGVDPSEALLAFARERHKRGIASFVEGDAMALPTDDRSFDAAVMALVIFFVPEPAKGVAEMVRVVRPGGSVSAYAWDMPGGGFPAHVFFEEIDRLGIARPAPPNEWASALPALRDLWAGAGLTDIETDIIPVERRFGGFEEVWSISMAGPALSTVARQLAPGQLHTLKEGVRGRVTVAADGSVTRRAWANAIRGRVPG